MPDGNVTEAELREMLRDLADNIERGGLQSVTLRFTTSDGEHEHTISVATDEERDAALVSIRRMLGQVH